MISPSSAPVTIRPSRFRSMQWTLWSAPLGRAARALHDRGQRRRDVRPPPPATAVMPPGTWTGDRAASASGRPSAWTTCAPSCPWSPIQSGAVGDRNENGGARTSGPGARKRKLGGKGGARAVRRAHHVVVKLDTQDRVGVALRVSDNARASAGGARVSRPATEARRTRGPLSSRRTRRTQRHVSVAMSHTRIVVSSDPDTTCGRWRGGTGRRGALKPQAAGARLAEG